MSDKARSLFPVSISFTSGEIPTPEKLSAIATQSRRGLGIVEYILGDTWNQGGDPFLAAVGLTDYALMIPNLARFLGKSNNTNPRVPYTTDVTSYNHIVSTSDVGKKECVLSLPPTGATTFTWTGTGAPSSLQSSIGDVTSTGKWYVDRTTGWCYFYDSIVSGWSVTYIPTIEGDLGSNATFNVIPDLDQESGYEFAGCKIAYKNNTNNSEGYIIYLPPRGPLDSDRILNRSPQSSYDISGNTANYSSTPDALPVKMWQSGSVTGTVGTYAEHYRYALPKVITDNYTNGATLPQGLIYLWDASQTGTIIEGVAFTAEDVASPRSYVLVASGTALNSWVDNYIGTAYVGCGGSTCLTNRDVHTNTYYPAAGLKVITIGSDITSVVSNLVKMFYNHDHGSANSLPGEIISHGKLKNKFSASVSEASSSVRVPTSAWSFDDHPQYIHRLGARSITAYRDLSKGGMLGDLIMCSTSSTSNYLNLLADSNKIWFGTYAGGGNTEPYISYCLNDDDTNSMNSLCLHYHKIAIGSPTGAAIEFRDRNSTWSYDEAARVYHTSGSEPKLSIERSDKTEGTGEGAALEVNRIYAGDSDELESGSGTNFSYNNNSYGPLRYYSIPPQKWYVYRTVLNSVADGASVYIPPNPDWDEGGAIPSGLSGLRGYNYTATEGFENWMVTLPTNTGGNIGVAQYFFDFPFAQYGIVGLRMSIKTAASTVPVSSYYIKVGSYKSSYSGGYTSTQYELIDLGSASVFGWMDNKNGLATATGTDWITIFTRSGATTSPIEIDNVSGTARYVPSAGSMYYISLISVASAPSIAIVGAEVIYRIKEW